MTPEILQESRLSSGTATRFTHFLEASISPSESDPRLVFVNEPQSPSADQYRRIASSFVSKCPTGGTLMITSPAPGDGKTLTAVNLAFCLAERGPTLLVDLDTHHCRVRPSLGLEPALFGIEDALLEIGAPADCVQSIRGTKLCVAASGGKDHRMVDLMGFGRPERFFAWALERFTWVVVDTPPIFPIADTLDIARHVMMGALVVRARKTSTRLAKQAIDALKGRLQFVIFNDDETPDYAIYNNSYYRVAKERGARRRG